MGLAGANLTPAPFPPPLVVRGFELTTVSPVTVLSYVPPVNQVLTIQATVNVTALATLTLTAAWTDPNTGFQTYTWENGTSLPAKVRLELPLLILAASGGAVTVTGQAGAANRIFITVSLERLS